MCSYWCSVGALPLSSGMLIFLEKAAYMSSLLDSIARRSVNMLSFLEGLNQFKCDMNIYVQTCAYGMYTSKLYKESK